MGSAYRDAPPESPAEPQPAFRDRGTLLGAAIRVLPWLVCFGMSIGFDTDPWGAARTLAIIMMATLAVSGIILLLAAPVQVALARRHARRVARGILELERKVSSRRG